MNVKYLGDVKLKLSLRGSGLLCKRNSGRLSRLSGRRLSDKSKKSGSSLYK